MEDRFVHESEERAEALQRDIETNLLELEAIGASYLSFRDVSRREFHDFVRPFLAHNPGIQALEWIPRVRHSDRAGYEESARRDGFPEFQFTERKAQGEMVRAADREEYFPVYYVEPYQSNEIALGFDLATNPTRREALELSRRTGRMLATARITLVQELGGQYGFLVFLPVYEKGAVLDREEERWERLEGYALGVFRAGDLFKKSMSYYRTKEIDGVLFDQSAPPEERFLAFHAARQDSAAAQPKEIREEALQSGLHRSFPLEIAGRKWTAVFAASPAYLQTERSRMAWLVLAMGLLFTGGVAAYLSLVLDRTAQAHRFGREILAAKERLEEEVAERKRVEERLSVTQKHLETVLSVTKTGIDIIDDEYNLRFVDAAWQKVYGDPVGRKCYEYFMGLDHPCPGCGIPRALETKEVQVSEETLPRENNRVVEVHTMPFQDDSGRWLVAETNVDITGRKEAYEALKESEARYKALFEGTAEGILVADIETKRFRYANPAICAMLGYTEAELTRLGIADIHPRESLEGIIAEFEAQARGEKTLALGLPCLRKDGAIFYANIMTAPVEMNGRMYNAGFFMDVTEQKRAERALRKSEGNYRTLIENLPQKIFLKDRRSVYISCNGNYARDLGITPEEIAGRTDYDFFPRELAEKYRADDKRLMDAGQSEEFEEQYVQDGKEAWVRTGKTPVRDERGAVAGILGIFWDITGQKEAEKGLRESEERFRSLVETSSD
ncbi:MAG: CHASE domain-containing protein [Planctomycetota bacterium]